MEERFCPNCGSTWVEPDTSNRAYVVYGGGGNKWKCNDCDFVGWMPEGNPEEDFDEDMADKIKFEPDEKYPREDLDFGRGYLKWLIYIAIPLTALYILFLLMV